MGCGASKGGGGGGDPPVDPAELKEEVSVILKKHVEPMIEDFDKILEPLVKEAGAEGGLDDEDDIPWEKSIEIRGKVWDDEKFEERYNEICKTVREEVEADVWPGVVEKLPPDGIKRKIAEKVARKAVDGAVDGGLKEAREETSTEPPFMDRRIKARIDACVKKHAEPFIAKEFKELQERKIASGGTWPSREEMTSEDLQKFTKECTNEANTAEVEAAAAKNFDDDIIPRIKKRLERRGTPPSGMKGKVIAAGIEKGKPKMIMASLKASLMASNKDEIAAKRQKEKEEAAAEKEEAAGGEESKPDEDKKEEEEDKKEEEEEEKKEEEEEKKEEEEDKKEEEEDKKEEEEEEKKEEEEEEKKEEEEDKKEEEEDKKEEEEDKKEEEEEKKEEEEEKKEEEEEDKKEEEEEEKKEEEDKKDD